MISAILFVSLIVLLFSSVPVAIAIGSSSLLVAWVSDIPLMVIAQRIFTTNDSFPLMAIPFFMVAGAVMTKGGVSQRLVNFASALVGALTGGLAMVVLVGCAFFAAISGSSAATVAAIGAIMIPTMEKRGYARHFSAGVTASGGALGMIIPPSIVMIIYGVAAEVSIVSLFLGGFIPGIFMMAAMMAVVYYYSKKEGYAGTEKFSGRAVWVTFKESFWGLLMPVIILGGIYGGIFTPTEAAAVGAAYGFIISLFVYKDMEFSQIPDVLLGAVKATAIVMFIMNSAGLFGWILVNHQIPQTIATALTSLTTNPNTLLLMLVGVMLIVGTFMNAAPAMVILAPILVPVVVAVGIDPIYFGVLMTIALTIGVVTPPVGVDLFVSSSIANIPIEKVARAAFPFIVAMIICVVLMIYFPQIIMFLPKLVQGI